MSSGNGGEGKRVAQLFSLAAAAVNAHRRRTAAQSSTKKMGIL